MANSGRQRAFGLLKIVLPVILIGWLVTRAYRGDPEAFTQLWEQEKRPLPLVAALVAALSAVSLSFVRWYLLVRALQLPFRLRDAFRLGSLGYLLNFVMPGSLGGDLFKAIFISKDLPEKKTEAVASILADRLLGLWGLVLFAALTIWMSGVAAAPPATATNTASETEDAATTEPLATDADTDQNASHGTTPPTTQTTTLRAIAIFAYTLAGVGSLLVALILLPGFTTGSVWEWFTSLPRVGPTLGRLIGAVRVYRQSPGTLLLAVLCSMTIHALLTLCIWLAAAGIYQSYPTLAEHAVIVPTANMAAGVPGFPGGLGAYELAMDTLYQQIPAVWQGAGKGIVMALCYRLITLIVAGTGILYYLFGRRQLRQAIDQAEQEASE